MEELDSNPLTMTIDVYLSQCTRLISTYKLTQAFSQGRSTRKGPKPFSFIFKGGLNAYNVKASGYCDKPANNYLHLCSFIQSSFSGSTVYSQQPTAVSFSFVKKQDSLASACGTVA